MPTLPPHPTLADLQAYVRDMEVERGFDEQTVLHKCLLLGEEMGELFKAIRKSDGMKIRPRTSGPPMKSLRTC